MQITDNTVAVFHYTLRDDQGGLLESSRDGEPSAYLHGAGNIIPGLEQALEGHGEGEELSVTLEPGQAYGPRKEGREQRVPVKHLVYRGRLRQGMVVQLNTSEGRLPVTVTRVGRHSATVDANHPLAGQTLTFEVTIVSVREASAEEREHGHAHGPGGHQH